MRSRYWTALLAIVPLAVSGLLSAGGVSAAPPAGRLASVVTAMAKVMPVDAPVAMAGRGSGAPRLFSARALATWPGNRFKPGPGDARPPAASLAPVRPDNGTRWLGTVPPVRPSVGRKPMPVTSQEGGVTAPVHLASLARPMTPPASTNLNADGANEVGTGLASDTPDPSVAVSPTEIAQTVNTTLQVYSKSGTQQCSIDLNSLKSVSSDLLNSPRIQYDNVNNRFSMAIEIDPGLSSPPGPAVYVLVSTSADACAGWSTFRMHFSLGNTAIQTLALPFLGQDHNAFLLSANAIIPNVPGKTSGGIAFSIPKFNLYNMVPINFPAFSVAFSAAPATVAGIPIEATTSSYYLASVPGTGYDLYRMTNSATPASTSLVLQATISAPFNSPTRQANQPGGSSSIVVGDGTMQSDAVLAQGMVWFTHEMDISGFPGIRYGEVNVATNAVTTAEAFHSESSDDFNSSIGVSDAGSGEFEVWLNWAYTDTPGGVGVSDTVDGLPAGTAVSSLIGTGLVLVTSTGTGSSGTPFGEYSSVAVDPGAGTLLCPSGRTAVITQEYFNSATFGWSTRIASLSFCQPLIINPH